MNDMSGNLHLASLRDHPNVKNAEAVAAIREALTILDAINMGELLDALPESREDRRRHQTGRTLLAMAEERLRRAVG